MSRRERIRAVLSITAVAAAAGGAVAVVSIVGDWGRPAAAPLVVTAAGPTALPTVAATEDTPYCPTPEEMRSYWEEHGQELKPTGDCPDPDPPLPADPSNSPEESATADPEDRPDTFAQAQALYDPENDPFILIDQAPDGSFYAIHGTPLEVTKATTPPAWVKTVDDYKRWAAAQDGRDNDAR